jgi:hypothetical protein
MNKPKKVLIFIHFSTYFDNLFGVARTLSKREGFEPVIVFPQAYSNISRHVELCTLNKIKCLDGDGTAINRIENFEKPFKKAAEVKKKYGSILNGVKFFIKELQRFVSQYKMLKARCSKIQEILEREGADLIILGGDVVGHETTLTIKAAHSCGVRSLAIVNWLGKYEAASIYYEDPSHQLRGPFGYLVKELFPKWIYTIQGKQILRIPAPDILAYELAKMSPPNPWILHSGDLDAIAVEGEVMRSDAILMGLRSDVVHATGIIQHDEMKWRVDNKENLRSNLYRQLNFGADKPLLLSALPPDFLYTVNGKPQCPNCDFKTYAELVEFWVKSIAQLSQFNIVITLHPSVNPENLKYIEKWGVRISQERTSDIMPLCDLFVASISATINWAIACGKPVINYDVYRYRYTDYVNASGVLTMEEKNEFLSTLFKLNDAEFFSQLTDKQVKEAALWARLDGLAAERILALVYENVN